MSNSLKSINSIVDDIMAAAKAKVGESLIDRAATINSVFDDAYGSCLGGHYASGMECAATGLRWIDELIDYAEKIMPTATGAEWEYVRDALGSIRMEKAPLQDTIIEEYNRRIKRYVSPTFGNNPKLYVCKFNGGEVENENSFAFNRFLRDGELESAELYTLGAGYYWDKQLSRWVLDALINPASRPELKKYM